MEYRKYMITIIHEYLFLGDSEAELNTRNTPKVTLDLTEWGFDLSSERIKYDRMYIHDLLGIITYCVDNEIPILVHCHGGIDRSPFIVACWLWFDYYCQNKEVSGLEAYDEVKRLHPATVIHDDWMRWFTQEGVALPRHPTPTEEE